MSGQERMEDVVEELQSIDSVKYTEEVAWPIAKKMVELHDELYGKCFEMLKELTDKQVQSVVSTLFKTE